MLSRIERALRILPEESTLVWLLFLFSVTTGSSLIFSYTAAFALFLSAFEETSFAYVFIVAGILSLVIGTLFTRLEQVVSKRRLFLVTLGVLLITSLLIQVGLWVGVGIWLFWIMLVWYRLYYILTNMSFWGVVSRVLNVEQSKRLIGTIASGELIILTIGYFITPWVVQRVGVNNLLLLNSATVFFSMLVVYQITPHLHDDQADQHRASNRSDVSLISIFSDLFASFRSLLSESYIRYIFSISFLTVFSYFVIDYGFYGVVRTQFEDPVSLATFIGYFWTTVYSVSLLIRFFATNRLLERYGLFIGLIALPITFGILSVLLLFGNLFSVTFITILVLMSLIKLAEDSFGASIHRTSTTLLYQPMHRDTSLSAQIVAESLIAPLGLGVAGLFILVFNNLPAFNLSYLSIIFVLVAVLWIYATREVFGGYVRSLTKALSQRRLQGSIAELSDSASLDVLNSYLSSDDPRKIVYVLNLLEKVAPDRIIDQIETYAHHDNQHVARTAIQIIGRLGIKEALPTVRELAKLQTPVSPEALYTLITLDEGAAVEKAAPYLEDDDVDLVGQAILGLLSHQEQEKTQLAVDHIVLLGRSDDPVRRAKAANIIGQLPGTTFADLLEQLIRDEHGSVRKEALNALIEIEHEDPHYLKYVITRLEDDQALFQQTLYALRHSNNRQADKILFNYITHSTPLYRTYALEGLAIHNYHVEGGQESKRVREAIEKELTLASWATASLSDLANKPETDALQGAISDLFEGCRQRLFKQLALLYNRQLVERVEVNYNNAKDKRQRTLALEALVNHIDYTHQTEITPFLLHDDSRARWESIKSHRGAERKVFLERLHALIANITFEGQDISDWIRSTAIYTAGKMGERGVSETIKRLQIAHNELIRETAIWATQQFEDSRS